MRSLLLVLCACGPVLAQDDAAVQALLAKFRAERADALKDKVDLAPADAAFAKAEVSAKAGEPMAAARLALDARWLIPVRPADLPPHVGLVIGAARLRHGDTVTGVAYSPDGTKLASSSTDGSVRVWDLANGRQLAAYRGHPAPTAKDPEKGVDALEAPRIGGLAWSLDGRQIASAGLKEAHIWDASTGKLERKLAGKHTSLVRCLAWSADGKRIATGGSDKLLVVWDAGTGNALYTSPPMNAPFEAVAFTPSAPTIAAADAEGFVVVVNPTEAKAPARVQGAETANQALTQLAYTADGAKMLLAGADRIAKFVTPPTATATTAAAPLLKFAGHTDAILGAAVSRDGKFLVTGGKDRTLRLWDAVAGKLLRNLQGHADDITAVAVRPDGKQAASGGADGLIRLWELSADDEHRTTTAAKEPLWAAATSPDGTLTATGGADRTVRIYDARGKLLHTLTGHAGAVTGLAFLGPDRLASSAGDKLVKLWNARDGKFLRDLPGHASAVLAVSASPDGKFLASASADKTAILWNLDAGTPAWNFNAKSMASAIAVRADGSRVAVGTADGTLTLLDAAGKPLASTAAHVAGVSALAFSPDGTAFASAGGDGLAKVWPLPKTAADPLSASAKFEVPARPGTNPIAALSAVGFSANGKQIVCGGADGIVRIFDIAGGKLVRELRGHTDWVTAVQFPTGTDKLVSAAADKTLRVFELGQAQYAARLAHARAASAVAVSRDGKWIASASKDLSVKLWDAATGKELASLEGVEKDPYSLAFVGADRLAVGGSDGRLRVFSVPDGKLVKATAAGTVYLVLPTAEGRFAVWSRNAGDRDEFALFSADGLLQGEPYFDKSTKATCVSFGADGKTLAFATEAGDVRMLDLAKKVPLGSDWKLMAKYACDIALTADGKTVYALDVEGTVSIGDVATRTTRARVKTVQPDGNRWAILLASPKNDGFATVGVDGDVRAYDAAGKLRRAWPLPVTVGGATYTPDGRALVTANADGTIYVLSLADASP